MMTLKNGIESTPVFPQGRMSLEQFMGLIQGDTGVEGITTVYVIDDPVEQPDYSPVYDPYDDGEEIVTVTSRVHEDDYATDEVEVTQGEIISNQLEQIIQLLLILTQRL